MKIEHLPIWPRIAALNTGTAKTPAGIWRAVKASGSKLRQAGPDVPGWGKNAPNRLALVDLYGTGLSGLPSRSNGVRRPRRTFTSEERADRRAKSDPTFRQPHLAALRRIVALAGKPCPNNRTLEGITKFVSGELPNRRNAAAHAAKRIADITSKTCPIPAAAPLPGHTLRIEPATARNLGAEVNLSGKDARTVSTRRRSHRVHAPGETQWKNGRPVGYTRATNDNYVRSFAVIRTPQKLEVAIHDRDFSLTLPDGYLWDADTSGVKAVCATSRGDDYHVTAEDCLAGSDAIVERLVANRARRLQFEAQNAATLAEMAGVFVCLADSTRAGNCRAGSLSFAERHGIDPSRHYHAPDLLRMANGDAGRVRLAISAATIRHNREVAQGFANLSEHQA